MNIILALKRPFIWLSRVRHRCGYGVHSPFAFELITCLFYEKTPYYAYKELAQEEKKQKRNHGKGWRNESLKVKRLLFRLVNRIQPGTIIDLVLHPLLPCICNPERQLPTIRLLPSFPNFFWKRTYP